jgi:hypothetical protein
MLNAAVFFPSFFFLTDVRERGGGYEHVGGMMRVFRVGKGRRERGTGRGRNFGTFCLKISPLKQREMKVLT